MNRMQCTYIYIFTSQLSMISHPIIYRHTNCTPGTDMCMTHMAGPSILAGVRATVIDVDVTVHSCPPHNTVTLVRIDQILEVVIEV